MKKTDDIPQEAFLLKPKSHDGLFLFYTRLIFGGLFFGSALVGALILSAGLFGLIAPDTVAFASILLLAFAGIGEYLINPLLPTLNSENRLKTGFKGYLLYRQSGDTEKDLGLISRLEQLAETGKYFLIEYERAMPKVVAANYRSMESDKLPLGFTHTVSPYPVHIQIEISPAQKKTAIEPLSVDFEFDGVKNLLVSPYRTKEFKGLSKFLEKDLMLYKNRVGTEASRTAQTIDELLVAMNYGLVNPKKTASPRSASMNWSKWLMCYLLLVLVVSCVHKLI